MLRHGLNRSRLFLKLPIVLSICGVAVGAQSAELRDFKHQKDGCKPSSVGLPFKNPVYHADFIWFADGDQPCSGHALGRITNIIHNHSKTPLIFKWPKAQIWADRHNPLPQGQTRGGPVIVYSVTALPDTGSPIYYTQSYKQVAQAATYQELVRAKASIGETDFSKLNIPNRLVTQVRTSAVGKDGIKEVNVRFAALTIPEKKSIVITINTLPNNYAVAFSIVPDYIAGLSPELKKQTIFGLRNLEKSHQVSFSIAPLVKLIGNDRAQYAPASLVKRQYLILRNVGGKKGVGFRLPISAGAKGQYDSKRFYTAAASLVVLDSSGNVLGNGRVSLWLPASRK